MNIKVDVQMDKNDLDKGVICFNWDGAGLDEVEYMLFMLWSGFEESCNALPYVAQHLIELLLRIESIILS